MSFLDKVFKKKTTEPVNSCQVCKMLSSAGRSGEKTVKFVDGDAVKIEIINESNIPGRMCYTLNLLDDAELGWISVPIRNCPWCGARLRRKK